MIIGSAYLRCSDPRQDKSIAQQREEIERRALADGVVIPPENWFVDEGISGRSSRKRAAYQAMIRRAEAQRDAQRVRGPRRRVGQPVERLYVWAFSRLARNMFDCLRALATLDDADIEVISLTEHDGGDRSIRKLIRPILAWLAERYSEELSCNVQRGMRSQAEKGLWVYGRPPFGYALVPAEEGGSRLAVTDETRPAFEVVQRLYAEYLQGLDGGKRLAERLTREGVMPPSRSDLPRRRLARAWNPKHVNQILTNPVYCGHLVYQGEVVARDTHEAVISEADFERVQALRKRKTRSTKRGGDGAVHPIRLGERGLFTPWLRCGLCGGRINVTVGGRPGSRDYYYYHCATRSQNRTCCDGLSIRVEKLDEALLAYIERELLDPENVDRLIRSALDQLHARPDELRHERERLEAHIAELDRRIRLAGMQVVEGVLTTEDARAINAPLMVQREEAQLRLAGLPAATALPGADEIDPTRFREAVLLAWQQRPLDERREALDHLLERVTLHEGGAEVEYAVRDAEIGFRHHAPYGPPWAPISFREPSASL